MKSHLMNCASASWALTFVFAKIKRRMEFKKQVNWDVSSLTFDGEDPAPIEIKNDRI